LKLGLSIPQVGVNATRANALKLAHAAEKENFESLWVQERILWPINPKSKYPASPDGSLREEYQHNLDSMNLLSYIAANTSKILLGTGIIENAYHLPVRFAGDVYSFAPASKIGEWDKLGMGHKPHPNEYINVNRHIEGKNYDTVEESSPVIQSGGIVTLLLDLGKNIGMVHDSQVKITTMQGNVFVSTIIIGQDSP